MMSLGPEHSTIPVAGFSSGMLPSGMNFNRLPHGSNVTYRGTVQPPPSSLQQWFEKAQKPALPPGYNVGSPVKVCHLLAPECQRYNGLIGDIYGVETVANPDGTEVVLFEVRCPVMLEPIHPGDHHRDPSLQAKYSTATLDAIDKNRHAVAPLYGVNAMLLQEGDERRLPPFILLSRLPSEKLEPLNTAAGSACPQQAGSGDTPSWHTNGQSGGPVALVLPPRWGEPLPPTFGAPIMAKDGEVRLEQRAEGAIGHRVATADLLAPGPAQSGVVGPCAGVGPAPTGRRVEFRDERFPGQTLLSASTGSSPYLPST